MNKRKTGTKEWATTNKNMIKGCEHDCQYCYAKSDAHRFGRIHRSKWSNMTLNERALKEKPKKVEGRIMFPSSHDIVPAFIDEIINYLRDWLSVGNEILIVSKPHASCIERICDELMRYREQITFRFTIGSIHNEVLKFWETNAPTYEERLASLICAFRRGYKTSVSAEPFLDSSIFQLYDDVEPYVTDTVWIGKMNMVKQRVDFSKWTKKNYDYLRMVEMVQTDEAIKILYETLKDEPKIRWKDSIKKVMGLDEYEGVA